MSNHVKGMTSCRPPESEIPNEKSNESEMDLINRRDAIDAVETKIKKWNAVDGEGYHVGLGLRYTDVIDTLTELPSAQLDLSGYSDRLWKAAYERGKAEAQSEIIRCKDCKHRIEHKHYGDLGESAYTCEGNMDGWILPDGFCSRGERRTDD